MAEGFWLFAICLFCMCFSATPMGVALPIGSRQDYRIGRLSSSVCEASGGQIYGVDFAALREQGDILWQMLKAFCHMP